MEGRNYYTDTSSTLYSYLQPLREYINKPKDQALAPTLPVSAAMTTATAMPSESMAAPAQTNLAAPASEPVLHRAKKSKRLQTPFTANITASLALARKNIEADTQTSLISSLAWSAATSIRSMVMKPAPINNNVTAPDINQEMEDLETKAKTQDDPDDVILQKVELARAQIVEHAARRVDIFFYILLAVKGKYLTASKDETVKQHGKGSDKKGTQACHSSIFPNIKFVATPPPEVKPYWALTLFSRNTTAAPSIPVPSLKGTFLEEVLNMTVELPAIVNGFDGHLEGRYQTSVYTRESLDIINRVSRNELDPIQGINAFLKMMNAFFTHMEYDYIKKPEYDCIKKENQTELPKSFKKVLEYEKMGTFHAANKDTFTIDDHYIYLMLRLNKTETMKSMIYSGALVSGYQKIQDEIYSSKNVIDDPSRMIA